MSSSALRDFVVALTHEVARPADEPQRLAAVRGHLATLIARDDWLPDALGQQTPVHDHTVWGLIGMLRGEEVAQPFGPDAGGRLVPQGAATRLRLGDIEAVSPALGDVHQVSNAFADRTSISIHVYGANIGAVHRWVYAEDGSRKPFVSGYSNSTVPNLWDRSKESA